MATGDIKRIIDMVKQHDGPGSGLDADKLDGLEATKFARRDTTESVQAGFLVRRQNSTNEGGEIKLEQSSNSDLQSAISLDNYDNLVRLFATKSNGHTAGVQIDIENTPDGIHTIWHSGNDGSGSGLDADKLDGHDSSYFATATHNHDSTYVKLTDYENSDVLNKIKNVDGSGSGLDADLLDGQHGSFYRNASNLNAGTVPTARLSGTYNISISGNASTATNADKWDGGHKHISSANPSGGINGDVWFKY